MIIISELEGVEYTWSLCDIGLVAIDRVKGFRYCCEVGTLSENEGIENTWSLSNIGLVAIDLVNGFRSDVNT